MPRAEPVQLIIRSRFARRRAHELAKQTGKTATEIIEAALRSYVAPTANSPRGKLVRKGPVLVRTVAGSTISLEQANAALDAARERNE